MLDSNPSTCLTLWPIDASVHDQQTVWPGSILTTEGVNPYPLDVRPTVAAQSIPSNGSTGGVNTLSMTWMPPFDAVTSAIVTIAASAPTVTAPSYTVIVSSSVFSVVTVFAPSARSVESVAPATT